MQMYKVFIDSLTIYFFNNDDFFNSDKKFKLDFYNVDNKDFYDILLNVINNNKGITKEIAFVSKDINSIWELFTSNYKKRVAAGGVVKDNFNNFLLIFRNNKWDLPKGHLDKGETILNCATREVEEECGISNLTILNKITTTYHTYIYNDDNILKEVHWFLMKYNGQETLIPQTEEGITKVEWKNKVEVYECLKNSYNSIIDVFANL